MDIIEENKKKIFKALFVFVVIISVYFVVRIFSEMKKMSLLGESTVPATITFSGHGEVSAVPDIANISFTIRSEEKTVKDAQTKVAVVEKKALDFLKSSKVVLKDIKTESSSFNPKYQYVYDTKMIPCTQFNCPMPTGKNVIIGYEAFESISVKIRNTDDVGKITQGLGGLGVSDLNGPNFSVDNEDLLKVQARKKAIDDAKTKAETLAKDLKIRLGKISSFSESGNYQPIMFKTSLVMDSVAAAAPVAQIPKGENTISADVNITYEIR